MVAYTFYTEDNRVMRYAEALAAAGHRAEVIALEEEGRPQEEMLEGVRVHRVQRRERDETSQLTYLARHLSFLRRAGRALGRLAAAGGSWDLIHVHNMPDFLVYAARAHKRRGARVILDIHDLVPELYAAKFGGRFGAPAVRLLRGIERASTGFADHVIVSNHLWEKALAARGVPVDKLSTFLNYPDPAVFAPYDEAAPNGVFRLVYPGSLHPHQGVDIAIEAVALAAPRVPGLRFDIYGGGKDRDRLEALARRVGATPQVTFHSRMPLRALRGAMAGAGAGVVPKRADGFGNSAFSTKTLEFMMLGLPVIVADTEVDTHYFNDRVVRFFRSGDARHLAEQIEDLAADPAGRRAQAERASAFVAAYRWDVRQADYLNLVERLVEERG